MPLAAGTQLGPYEIVSAIGAGGMGDVYKARDTRLDRTVAIKVLPEHVASDPDLKQRFEREAKTISSLNHPHICTLYDIGSQDGIDFLVMEYLEGDTLAQRLEKGALPLDQALTVAIEIADALDKAHRQGITHRDLKPGNIMLTESGAKLLDFGLAKLRPAEQAGGPTALPTQDASLTQHGTVLGTMPYMAPEQLEGGQADARTDIWALGCILHEMVTGARPFQGDTQARLIAAIMTSKPDPPTRTQPLIPPRFDEVVRRCPEKDAERRWQSARDVAMELKSTSSDREHQKLSGTAHSSTRPSIAVLPFANLSGGETNEFLADGMTGDVITLLSGDPNLSVVARNSSFSYKGQYRDARQVAEELRVRYLVEGGVRAVGERVRVTVQLIEAESGRHLWAQRFDRPISEIFDVQDDIVEGIVVSLGGEVYRAEGERVRRRPPESLDAWGLAARATTELGKLGTTGFEEVETLTRRAIELDPALALPHVLLANALAMRSTFSPKDSDLDEALRAAEHAMTLAPDDPLVLAYAANALTWLHEGERAVAIVKRAIDLAPNIVTSYGALAHAYMSLRRSEEAIEYAKGAIHMSPRDLSLGRWYTTMATAYGYSGQWQEAHEAATVATERMPNFAAAWVTRAWALLKMEQFDKAVGAARTATEPRVQLLAVMALPRRCPCGGRRWRCGGRCRASRCRTRAQPLAVVGDTGQRFRTRRQRGRSEQGLGACEEPVARPLGREGRKARRTRGLAAGGSARLVLRQAERAVSQNVATLIQKWFQRTPAPRPQPLSPPSNRKRGCPHTREQLGRGADGPRPDPLDPPSSHCHCHRTATPLPWQ